MSKRALTLIDQPRFVVWKTKDAPTSAITRRRKNWIDNLATLAQAQAFVAQDSDYQIGYVFGDDDIYGLDIDGARDPETEEIEAWAQPFLNLLKGKAIADISVSGTGVKLIFKCQEKLEHTTKMFTNAKGHGAHQPQIELFTNSKYFAWTDRPLDGFECEELLPIAAQEVRKLMHKAVPFQQSNCLSMANKADSKASYDRSKWKADELVHLLDQLPKEPCSERNLWRDVIFAVHFETDGGADGLALVKSWSEGIGGYDGPASIEDVWNSAKPDADRPIHAGSILRRMQLEGDALFNPLGARSVLSLREKTIGRERTLIDSGEISEMKMAEFLLEDIVNESFLVKNSDQSHAEWFQLRDGLLHSVDKSLAIDRPVRAKIRDLVNIAKESGCRNLRSFEGDRKVRAVANWIKEMVPETPDSKLNGKPHELNMKNGILDMKTGKLRPHNSIDLFTRQSSIEYDPAAKCPLWLTHVDTCLRGNKPMATYLQTLLGYSMHAGNPAHAICFLYGSGGNGKSVTIETVAQILGSYSEVSTVDLIMGKSDESRILKCGLRDKRLAAISEPSEGCRLNEGTVKELSGAKTIKCRNIRSKYESFGVTHTLFVDTNKVPVIVGQDDGIWRRIHRVDFDFNFLESGKKIEGFDEQLLAEHAGIFNWLLEGYQRYVAAGKLEVPDEAALIVRNWRGDEDALGAWLEENVLRTDREDDVVPAVDICRAFNRSCAGQTLQSRQLIGELVRRGFERVQTSPTAKRAAKFQKVKLRQQVSATDFGSK